MYYQVMPMPLSREETLYMVIDAHNKLNEPFASQAEAQVRADELNAQYERILNVL